MTEHDAVVYDLDGTLVRLAVDWNAVTADVRAVYDRYGTSPPGDSLWEMVDAPEADGLAAAVETAITEHEREGARRSRRLAHAEELLEREVPTAVCSLNSEISCQIALEEHELDTAVEAVVGRDTVPSRKPAPEPLLEAVSAVGADPSSTLFVGDSETDELAARRAGTDFEYVDPETNE